MRRILIQNLVVAVGLAVWTDPLARAGEAGGADWNQWGGANRDFVVSGPDELPVWPGLGPLVLWERALGPGYSGMVSDGERLLTMTRRGANEVVVALDRKSGVTRWEYVYSAPAEPFDHLDTTWGAGPNSTPLIAEGRVYTVGFTGKVHCIDAANGNPIWNYDLGASVNGAVPYFGLSSSPLRFGKLLIVIAGGAHAFDLETGELRWANHDFEASYASPVLLQRGGLTQVIVPVAGEVVSLDPASGKLLWRYEHANEHRTFLSGPVLGKDNLLFASAYFLGSVGLRLEPDGSGVTAMWKNNRFQLSQGNSIRDGNVVFGFHNSILTALDMTSGEILWQRRGFQRANLVRSGDRYVLLDRYGKLSIVSLGKEGPTTHGEAQILEGRSWTAPTLIGSHLYARNLDRVVALDLGRSPQAGVGRSASARPTRAAPRTAVEAPEGFLLAKKRLMRAYFRSETEGLKAARSEFGRWVQDEALGHLAHYYIGFSAHQHAFLAQGNAQLRLLQEAERHMKSALAVDSSLAEAHAFLARIYPAYYRFDPERAAVVGPLGDEHLENALRLDPDNPRVIAVQGLDLFYSPAEYGGDRDRGLALLHRAVKLLDERPQAPPRAEPDWGPATVRGWYGRALLLGPTAERGRAIEVLRRALAIEPDFASVRRMLETADEGE